MTDADCIEFLKWALPQLDLRWPGFRKVRRQVCKRLRRRLRSLGLSDLKDYRARLADDPAEWTVLDELCRITISRFYRDKRVFDVLARDLLPEFAARARSDGRGVRCWCAGCASGEEVFTLKILWDSTVGPAYPDIDFTIIGTDAEPVMIARAERGCYSAGSLRDIPESLRADAFSASDGLECVGDRHRRGVTFLLQDIREEMPDGPFDLILCRNLVFTYFAPVLQRAVLDRLTARLRPEGHLVIGAHETLPLRGHRFERLDECREIYWRKRRIACAPIA